MISSYGSLVMKINCLICLYHILSDKNQKITQRLYHRMLHKTILFSEVQLIKLIFKLLFIHTSWEKWLIHIFPKSEEKC